MQKKKFFIEHIIIYEKDVYRYLISITGEPQISEDLLQNTMEKAWGKLGQLREPSKAKSWLFSIARNEANQHYRNSENTYFYIDEMDGKYDNSLELAREKSDVLESLVRDFDMNSMRRALQMLDGKYKKLIMMHYFQGLNQREIADILDQNHSTVRVNLVRALKKVREIRDQIERGEVDGTIK